MVGGIAIAVEDVFKTYGDGKVTALEGINLEIDAGEWVAVIGPTGSGKSTLLAVLALLEEADRGIVRLGGTLAHELGSAERWRAGNLGIVFQFHHLLPHLTLLENVQLPLIQPGHQWRTTIDRSSEALDEVGLSHRSNVLAAHVSGGERQLCAVARALVVEPRLVLADEPTGNVDPATGERVITLLSSWADARGATLLTVTHQPTLAERADRIIALEAGRVVSG